MNFILMKCISVNLPLFYSVKWPEPKMKNQLTNFKKSHKICVEIQAFGDINILTFPVKVS